MRARLLYQSKSRVHGRYAVELVVHEVGKSERYPDGIKYGLICFDLKTGRKILMDNHHPKGPHIHIDDLEVSYVFVSDEKLIEDFKELVFEKMGVKL
ncbi:MAG: hypothetical protein NDJ89_08815 [Oligoflexia bacterium]|nr:hypothetical protein [Oligoflexia bacterium]